jgi:hypothetical protein
LEHRIIRPDGVTRILNVQAKSIHDAAGNLLRIQGTTQDITERRQAEERIEKPLDEPATVEAVARWQGLDLDQWFTLEPAAPRPGSRITCAPVGIGDAASSRTTVANRRKLCRLGGGSIMSIVVAKRHEAGLRPDGPADAGAGAMLSRHRSARDHALATSGSCESGWLRQPAGQAGGCRKPFMPVGQSLPVETVDTSGGPLKCERDE